MYGSKQTGNVVLFPLCDARGDLVSALCDTSDSPATRGDALVFAWRLELPSNINLAKAANAILMVALSVPRKSWTRHQLLMVRELMVLAGREVARSTVKPARGGIRVKPGLAKSPITPRPTAPRHAEKPARAAKESKEWWTLVGKQEPDNEPGRQRKTRKGRVSRKPL